jgi:hypothetical protein
VVTPAAKRKAVAHLMNQHGMSEWRACKTMGCCRMTIRYETARGDDRDLRERMKRMSVDLDKSCGQGQLQTPSRYPFEGSAITSFNAKMHL